MQKMQKFFVFFLLFYVQAYANSDVFTMVSLGDSVTTAFNSDGWGDSKESSWATGNNSFVNSHYTRLKGELNYLVKVFNLAKSGARSYNLPAQLANMKNIVPDYATIFIGANDLCEWREAGYKEKLLAYSDRINKTLVEIIDKNEQVKILMLPIPDMMILREVGLRNDCQWKWDLLSLCNPLLHSTRSANEIDEFENRLREMNLVLEEIAETHSSHVIFDPTVADYQFSWEEVSPKDCFHPSLRGQQTIAEQTWPGINIITE